MTTHALQEEPVSAVLQFNTCLELPFLNVDSRVLGYQRTHSGNAWRLTQQSPEQGIKYTTAALICFGPGKIIMELMGYFWGCVKETYTGPVLEPSEARGRLFLISVSFGWDAWFPCAADTFTKYWYFNMYLWTGRHRKMPCSVYHEMNRNAVVE